MRVLYPWRVADARQLGRVTCADCRARASMAPVLGVVRPARVECACSRPCAPRGVDLGDDGVSVYCAGCLPSHLAAAAEPLPPGAFELPAGWTEHALDGTAHCPACSSTLEPADDTGEDAEADVTCVYCGAEQAVSPRPRIEARPDLDTPRCNACGSHLESADEETR